MRDRTKSRLEIIRFKNMSLLMVWMEILRKIYMLSMYSNIHINFIVINFTGNSHVWLFWLTNWNRCFIIVFIFQKSSRRKFLVMLVGFDIQANAFIFVLRSSVMVINCTRKLFAILKTATSYTVHLMHSMFGSKIVPAFIDSR